MVRSKKVLTVFLASPSDLPDERRYARSAAEEWNLVNSDRTGWVIDLLGWEDTLPQAGRPQEIINAEIRRCLMFIGMMHRSWGNPTGNGYTSGFHEEFELARDLNAKNKSPDISLFFKALGSVSDPGEQLKRVLDFREEITASKKFFYKELSAESAKWNDDFRAIFHRLIFDKIATLDRESQPVPDDDGESSEVALGVASHVKTSQEFREKMNALSAISSRLDQAPNDYEVSPVDVARLRLIASTWHRPGMTDSYLGTHDANIVFRQGNSGEISDTEKYGLIDAALIFWSSQTAPLWRWISEADSDFSYLRITALYGADESVRIGALNALSAAQVDFGDLQSQFASVFEDSRPVVRNAMLNYIAAVGEGDGLEVALKEFQKADFATLAPATNAVLQVKRRNSPVEAATFAIEKNVGIPNNSDGEEIRAALDFISDDYLGLGLAHRDAEVRVSALRVLDDRGQLTSNQRAELLGDPSPAVRAAAVDVALKSGESLSISDCEKIIVRQEKSAFGSMPKGQDEFDNVRRGLLIHADTDALLKEADSLYQPAEFAYAALVAREWRSRADEARTHVRERFKSYFEKVQGNYRIRFGDLAANLVKQESKESMFDYRANKMTRELLNVFAVKGNKSDVSMFREAMKSEFFVISKSDLAFLARFGTIDDIEAIAKANRNGGASVLFPTYSATIEDVARTVLKLAKGNLHILFKREISNDVKRNATRLANKSSILSLKDADITDMLSEKDDDLRKMVALRVAECLPKKRVKHLDALHYSLPYHYYNVTHWLDLSASMPSRTVSDVARYYRRTSD